MDDFGEEPRARAGYGSPRSEPSLEVSVAAMENRLREQITDLINPTIQRTSLLVSDVDILKGLVFKNTEGLQECQLGNFKVIEQVCTINAFREDMGKWDLQLRQQEVMMDEKLEAMEQRIQAFQYSLEQKESVLNHLQRSIELVTGEVNRVVDEQELQLGTSSTRFDELSLTISKLRTELEIQVAGMQMRHNAITDELWGEETGLAKLGGELVRAKESVSELKASVKELYETKAEKDALDLVRSEVARTASDTNAAVADLKQNVSTVVADVREHFKTASETISAHNAAFVNEVRKEYEEELRLAATLRGEVKSFMEHTDQGMSVLDSRAAATDRKASSLAGEVREEIEDLNRRRKRDKASSDNELKMLKKRLGGLFDNSDMVLRGIEHIYSVVDMVLQSENASCSVDLQDSQDRKRIALMGVKDDEATLARTSATQPQYPRAECRRQAGTAYGPKKPAAPGTASTPPTSARAGTAPASARAGAQEQVVRVDNRCLSCSGQSPLVLSAFKMACLQYTPSPVFMGGSHRDRDEVLQERSQLLERARHLLSSGPLNKGGGASGGREGFGAFLGPEGFDQGDLLSGYGTLDAATTASSTGRTGGFRLPGLPPSSPSLVSTH